MPYSYRKVRDQRDIGRTRNWMAEGNYPLSMSDCEVVGINGDCGLECPVLIRGDCPSEHEMLSGD